MKRSFAAGFLVLAFLVSACSPDSSSNPGSLTVPGQTHKGFAVFVDLEDSDPWSGVVNIHSATVRDYVTMFTCGEKNLKKLQKVYDVYSDAMIPMGTLESLKLSHVGLQIRGSGGDVLALPVSEQVITNGSSSCSVKFNFMNVPFDNKPFMIDFPTTWDTDSMWFNASEALDGKVRIKVKSIEIAPKS